MATTATTTKTAPVVLGIDPSDAAFYAAFDAMLPTLRAAFAGRPIQAPPTEAVIECLADSIARNQRVVMVYQTPSDRGPGHIKARWLRRISHINETEDGAVVVKALDVTFTWSNEQKAFVPDKHDAKGDDPWRNFRVERILSIAQAGPGRPYAEEYKGKVWVYPVVWKLRKGSPLQCFPGAVERLARQGWSLQPSAEILRPNEEERAAVTTKREKVAAAQPRAESQKTIIVTTPTLTAPTAPADEQPSLAAAYAEKRMSKAEMLHSLAEYRAMLSDDAVEGGKPCGGVLENGDLCGAPTIGGSAFCIRHHDAEMPRYAAAMRNLIELTERYIDGGRTA